MKPFVVENYQAIHSLTLNMAGDPMLGEEIFFEVIEKLNRTQGNYLTFELCKIAIKQVLFDKFRYEDGKGAKRDSNLFDANVDVVEEIDVSNDTHLKMVIDSLMDKYEGSIYKSVAIDYWLNSMKEEAILTKYNISVGYFRVVLSRVRNTVREELLK